MKTNTMISLLCLLMGSVAFGAAGEKRTEYFWQPGGSMNSVTADFLYSNASYQQDTAATSKGDGAHSEKKLSVNYQYGLTPDWALGVVLATGQNDFSATPTGGGVSVMNGYNGLYDLVFTAHNTTPMGVWNLHYGADLNYSLGKGRISNTSNEGVNQSGGMGLRPYVGGSMDLAGIGMVGGSFSYWWKGDRSVDPQITNDSAKEKGGDVMDINAFYEYHADMWEVDAHLGMKSMAEDKIVISDTSGNTTNLTTESYSTMYLSVGGQYHFMPTALVRLSYQMDMVPDHKWDKDNAYSIYAYNGNTIDIMGRYEF